MQSEMDAAAESVAMTINSIGCTLQDVSAAFESVRPALRELAATWFRMMEDRERTLRERLGIWRYLSPDWWALRKYRKESGDAGG